MNTDIQKTADDILLNKYTPTGVVVNKAMDIVHFRGGTSIFLEQQAGKPSHNLFRIAKAGLAFELRNMMHKVVKEHISVLKENIPLQINGIDHIIAIEAIPLPDVIEPHYLILFHAPPEGYDTIKTIRGETKKDEKDLIIQDLKNRLEKIREEMRSVSEDQEVVNEELQSANEELQSSSEELISVNEELERSKEELQSINEGITAVNQGLVSLNEQVTEEKNYAIAIIRTIHEPLLVLDKNLKIKTASSSFYKKFQVNKQETVGSLIYELGNKQWDIPALRTLLESILPEKESFFDVEVSHNFESIGQRDMLLNASEITRKKNSEKLILLAIEDITERKQLQQKENELLIKYQNLLIHSPVAIISLKGKDYNVELANHYFLQLVEKGKTFIGKPLFESLPELKNQGIKEILDNVMQTGVPFTGNELEVKILRNKKSEQGFFNFVYQPTRELDGSITGIIGVATEVTEQVLARKKVEEIVNKYHEIIYSSHSLTAILKGKEMIVEIANDAILKAWGKGKNVIGKPLLEILPEWIEQGLGDLLHKVYNTGNPEYGYELPVNIVRNGKKELSYYTFVYQAQRDIDGKIVGVAIISTEVKQQAELNKKIKESEEKYRQMTDLMPDKISNSDADGNVFYYNKNWSDYTGLSLEELKKHGWAKIMHPDEQDEIAKQWQHSVETGNDFEMELRCLDKNGEYKWHLSRATPVKDETGKIKLWIGSNTQIHKLKEEEKRKEDFLKMVSHELKTPVTSIKGYVQLLLSMLKVDTNLNPSSIPFIPSLERIDTQISRLTRLIAEMLDLSRLEDSKLELQKEIFSINQLVDETVQDINLMSTQKIIDISHEFNCEINADKDRIGQVLINFITNAIKYSPENDKVKICIYKTGKNQVSVSIKDNGIGISKKDHKNIFQRFYRVDGKNEKTYSGLGIGLYLANEIIDRHNGIISVNSKKGKGSEFIFTLAFISENKI